MSMGGCGCIEISLVAGMPRVCAWAPHAMQPQAEHLFCACGRPGRKSLTLVG